MSPLTHLDYTSSDRYQGYREYVSSGEGLESFSMISPDGQISLTFDLKQQVPDLLMDHVSGGAT